MSSLDAIGTSVMPPAVVDAFGRALAALGTEHFADGTIEAVRRLVEIDRLYLFEGGARGEALTPFIRFHEPDKPMVATQTYAEQFFPRDPLQRAIGAAGKTNLMIRLRVSPTDITATGYRHMLERSGIVDRVSFLQQSGIGWQCMTVARRRRNGPFSAAELGLLGGFAPLLLPMVRQNGILMRTQRRSTTETVDELEARFARAFPTLPRRERQVVARAAIGMSVEGAAFDLGIGASSILTYRRRAYERLGVTSAFELSALVMR